MPPPEPYLGFEQGPIRPPSEAASLLVRITRNCPWNRCTFCPVYKGEQFSRRPVDHVLKDIDLVHRYVEKLIAARADGTLQRRELYALHLPGDDHDRRALHAAYQFVTGGMRSIFLQDGNSLIIKPQDLIRILDHLKATFPTVERITSYARSQTIARISDQDLHAIASAGLNRIHIGLESGSDRVLRLVSKGADKATHITAGQKVKRAGIELSEYYMPGLGGEQYTLEHARESADALNQINPDFIRLRTLALPEGIPLTDSLRGGNFKKLGEVATARELVSFMEQLQVQDSILKSDHMLNLFQELEGHLASDKERMLATLHAFLEMAPEEQVLFCIGRRTQRLQRLADLENPDLREQVTAICHSLAVTYENMDQVIDELMRRFI